MIGSAMSFAGYLFVLFLLSIWTVMRIWKKSPLLAILCFFFWPATIVALFTNWGDEDSDIRIPFFLSVVVSGLMFFMAMRTVDQGISEMAYALSDEDIAEIRASDPELAQALLEARQEQQAALGGEPGQDAEFDEVAGADAAAPGNVSGNLERTDDNTVEPRPAAAPRAPAVLDAEHRGNLERTAANIAWQFRRVALPAANATLHLTEHFRFTPRANLIYFARLRAAALPADVFGGVVHRDVNLAREDAWYVQVRHVPLPHAPALPEAFGDADARAAAQAEYVGRLAAALGVDASTVQAPAWDAASGVATWQRGGADPATPYADFVAVRVLPGGLVECVVPNLHVAKAELGTRAARLVASQVAVAGN